MNPELTLQNILILLTLQFAVFGWRILREINVADQTRRTWFPVNDIINLANMLSVLIFCIVLPLTKNESNSAITQSHFAVSARVAFAIGITFLVFHPLSMVAHYGLLNKEGRQGFLKKYKDFPYFPNQEKVVVAISAAAAFVVFGLVCGLF